MPALTVGYITGRDTEPGKPTALSQPVSKFALYLQGDVTLSLKAAHCKHSLERCPR